jgi:hypothetical protein
VPVSPFRRWVQSDDCEHIYGQAIVITQDGYVVAIYRSRSTGRYLVEVEVEEAGGSHRRVYTADTLDGARAVGAAGYTPGHGPGRFCYVRRPERLSEVRALREAETSPVALADALDSTGTWDWCDDAEHGPCDRYAVVESWGTWWVVYRGSKPYGAEEVSASRGWRSERAARRRLEELVAQLKPD